MRRASADRGAPIVDEEVSMSNVAMRILLSALLSVTAGLPLVAFAAGEAVPVHTIYLVRHGAYAPDPRIDPAQGPPLTSLGIAQARLVGARLRALPAPIASVTSSTMTRAKETAAVIHELFANVPGTSSELLSECTPPALVAIRGESEASQRACASRLDEAFAKFAAPVSGSSRHDVLVCHGNVIRYFVTKALGIDSRAWTGMSVAHASITVIEIGPNGASRVTAVGDSGHIPPNLLSFGTAADPELVVPKASAFTR
jgi:serine/threonine-protein phosphatase PGAM5